jgi:hypothetical protein
MVLKRIYFYIPHNGYDLDVSKQIRLSPIIAIALIFATGAIAIIKIKPVLAQ